MRRSSARAWKQRGEHFETSTDSEVLTRAIACAPGRTIGDRLRAAMDDFEGAYSLALLTPTEMYAVRDPLGLRPLSLGRLGNGWVVASETCALATTGAAFVRDVAPGEIVRITAEAGPESLALVPGERDALCVFELIYFARPDSMMGGDRIHLLRQRMGAELAREQPADADIVVPLPDSAIPAGIGYAASQRHPIRGGADQESLHRAHLHPARPASARGRHRPQVQPAARKCSKGSASC